MKSSQLLLSAAVSGILAGAAFAGDGKKSDAPASPGTSSTAAPAVEKHACKGMNSCQGKGGCKTDAHGCAGMNACKGQGGCATAKHACKGQNECKSLGGCKTDKNACRGQNACKGQGGCAVPPAATPAAPVPATP